MTDLKDTAQTVSCELKDAWTRRTVFVQMTVRVANSPHCFQSRSHGFPHFYPNLMFMYLCWHFRFVSFFLNNVIQYADLHVKVIGYDVNVVDTHIDRMEVLL